MFKKFKLKKEKKNNEEKKMTNYEKAKKEFHDHNQNLAKTLHTWKIFSFVCVLVMSISVLGTLYLSTRGTLIPYVIEVDSTGNAKAINPAYQKNYDPTEENILYSLKEFVRNSRWISLDPVMQNKLYSKSLTYLTGEMQEKLRQISSEEDLSKLMKDKYSRDVNIKSIIKVAGTKSTYQIKWLETLYTSEGEVAASNTLVGIFTIKIISPKTLQELDVNPLGIYIKDFHISVDKN